MAINKGEIINLNDWFLDERNDEAKRELFVGVSDAQKSLNDIGYGIGSFNFNDIYLEDGDSRKAQFGIVNPLPEDIEEKRKVVSNEIFILALMQIGIYSDCLNNITSNSVRDNFDLFSPFLPAEDIPYFKSVVADHFDNKSRCVYFCDYARELYKRTPNNENTDSEQTNSDSKVLSKRNGNKLVEVLDEFKPKDINGNKNAAYINFIIIPLGVIIAGIALTIISWFIK